MVGSVQANRIAHLRTLNGVSLEGKQLKFRALNGQEDHRIRAIRSTSFAGLILRGVQSLLGLFNVRIIDTVELQDVTAKVKKLLIFHRQFEKQESVRIDDSFMHPLEFHLNYVEPLGRIVKNHGGKVTPLWSESPPPKVAIELNGVTQIFKAADITADFPRAKRIIEAHAILGNQFSVTSNGVRLTGLKHLSSDSKYYVSQYCTNHTVQEFANWLKELEGYGIELTSQGRQACYTIGQGEPLWFSTPIGRLKLKPNQLPKELAKIAEANKLINQALQHPARRQTRITFNLPRQSLLGKTIPELNKILARLDQIQQQSRAGVHGVAYPVKGHFLWTDKTTGEKTVFAIIPAPSQLRQFQKLVKAQRQQVNKDDLRPLWIERQATSLRAAFIMENPLLPWLEATCFRGTSTNRFVSCFQTAGQYDPPTTPDKFRSCAIEASKLMYKPGRGEIAPNGSVNDLKTVGEVLQKIDPTLLKRIGIDLKKPLTGQAQTKFKDAIYMAQKYPEPSFESAFTKQLFGLIAEGQTATPQLITRLVPSPGAARDQLLEHVFEQPWWSPTERLELLEMITDPKLKQKCVANNKEMVEHEEEELGLMVQKLQQGEITIRASNGMEFHCSQADLDRFTELLEQQPGMHVNILNERFNSKAASVLEIDTLPPLAVAAALLLIRQEPTDTVPEWALFKAGDYFFQADNILVRRFGWRRERAFEMFYKAFKNESAYSYISVSDIVNRAAYKGIGEVKRALEVAEGLLTKEKNPIQIAYYEKLIEDLEAKRDDWLPQIKRELEATLPARMPQRLRAEGANALFVAAVAEGKALGFSRADLEPLGVTDERIEQWLIKRLDEAKTLDDYLAIRDGLKLLEAEGQWNALLAPIAEQIVDRTPPDYIAMEGITALYPECKELTAPFQKMLYQKIMSGQVEETLSSRQEQLGELFQFLKANFPKDKRDLKYFAKNLAAMVSNMPKDRGETGNPLTDAFRRAVAKQVTDLVAHFEAVDFGLDLTEAADRELAASLKSIFSGQEPGALEQVTGVRASFEIEMAVEYDQLLASLTAQALSGGSLESAVITICSLDKMLPMADIVKLMKRAEKASGEHFEPGWEGRLKEQMRKISMGPRLKTQRAYLPILLKVPEQDRPRIRAQLMAIRASLTKREIEHLYREQRFPIDVQKSEASGWQLTPNPLPGIDYSRQAIRRHFRFPG